MSNENKANDKNVPEVQGKAASPPSATSEDVKAFVAQLKALAPQPGGRGRLIFAMDATMSREPTWDLALSIQSEMFRAVAAIGTLDVQLMYFRGAGEARVSRWVRDADALSGLMRRVSCHGGYTQIAKVLAHARQETAKAKVNALVFVGDAMEENVDDLAGRAGELALLGVPVFLFLEGSNGEAERAFREIARLTKGAFCRFGTGSADELRDLLTAVAVYAAGGRAALARLAAGTNEGARLLLAQMPGHKT